MSPERKPFDIRVAGRELSLSMGKCACVLFRHQQEVDYLAINTTEEDDEESSVLRIFNNVKLVRWMAGLVIHEDGFGLTTADGQTFANEYGWSPPVIIKDNPSADELEWFMDVNAGNIDEEWRAGLE